MPPCRPPTGSKLRNVQVLLTFLMCVNLQHFVTERDIRASVDTLCRDGTSEISLDLHAKRLQTQRERLAEP